MAPLAFRASSWASCSSGVRGRREPSSRTVWERPSCGRYHPAVATGGSQPLSVTLCDDDRRQLVGTAGATQREGTRPHTRCARGMCTSQAAAHTHAGEHCTALYYTALTTHSTNSYDLQSHSTARQSHTGGHTSVAVLSCVLCASALPMHHRGRAGCMYTRRVGCEGRLVGAQPGHHLGKAVDLERCHQRRHRRHRGPTSLLQERCAIRPVRR